MAVDPFKAHSNFYTVHTVSHARDFNYIVATYVKKESSEGRFSSWTIKQNEERHHQVYILKVTMLLMLLMLFKS